MDGDERLGEVSQAGQLPLLSDVLGVSVAVDDVTYSAERQGTASSVKSPFYRPGAPRRTQIRRDDEPGDVCFVSGRVIDATKLSGAGYEPRTTQLFLEGGAHLDDDTIGAVKPELTGRLEKHDDPEQPGRLGLDRPFFTYAYDFALVPDTSKEGAGDGP